MAKTGMALPVQVNRKGGARLISGTPYVEQVIKAGLTPNTSKNPFQAGDGVEVGISERIVFMVNDDQAQGFTRGQVINFFKRMREQGLAKLAPGREGINFRKDGEELIAEIGYVDLEADKEGVVEVNVKGALSGSPKVTYGI